MTTDPGAVPKNAVPLTDSDDVESGTVGRYCRAVNLATLRKRDVCTKCAAFKPERAHHCTICNRCVVKVIYALQKNVGCIALYLFGLGNELAYTIFMFALLMIVILYIHSNDFLSVRNNSFAVIHIMFCDMAKTNP